MTISIKLKGLKIAQRKMSRVLVEIGEAVKDTNAKIANRIKGDARRTVPVFHGNLRKTIVIKTMNTNVRFQVLIGSRSKYAMKIEMGYGGMSRLPSIRKIREWVNFKGLPEAMAMPLAIKLKRKGSPAQPFLVPAFDKHIRKYADILRFRLARIN